MAAATKTDFGTLVISITSGSSTDELKGKEKEFFMAKIILPKELGVTSSQTIQTSKQLLGNINDWSASGEIEMKRSVVSAPPIKVEVEQVGIINRLIGTGYLSLDCLSNGGRASERVNIMDKSILGTEKYPASVALALHWATDTPAYLRQATVDVTANNSASSAASVSGARSVKKPVELAPLPECEGRAYSVRVIAHKARNLQSNDDTALYNPLVSVTIGDETRKTESLKGDNNPYFDEELMFMLPKAEANFWSMPIQINVMHNPMIGPKKLIGMGQMDMAAVYRSPQHFMQNKWLVLRKGELSTQIMGFLKVSVMVLDALKDTIPEAESEDEDVDDNDEEIVMGLINAPGATFEEVYMRCEIYKAQHLPAMDPNGLADPFVRLLYGVKKTQIGFKPMTLNPTWDCVTCLPVLLPSMTDTVLLQLWDYDGIGSDEVIATHKMNFSQLIDPTSGLPNLSARYINFYGCPRDAATLFGIRIPNEFNDKMDLGTKPGVDYRGRLLLRMSGTRDRNVAILPLLAEARPREVKVTIRVTLQALQFSMLEEGEYSLCLSCANSSQSKNTHKSKGMTMNVGQKSEICDDSKLQNIFFEEELSIDVELPIALPAEVIDEIPFDRANKFANVTDDYEAFIISQVPDCIIHLQQKRIGGKAMYASARIPAQDLIGSKSLVKKTVSADGRITTRPLHKCMVFTPIVDPDKAKEGKAPLTPMGQFYVSMCILKSQPDTAVVEKLVSSVAPVALQSAQNTGTFFRMEVFVHQARQVPAGDSNGLSDPYIRITWADAVAKTGVQLETLNPSFNQMLIIDPTKLLNTQLPDVVVELWDWDLVGSDTFLARMVIPFQTIKTIADGETKVTDFDLNDVKKTDLEKAEERKAEWFSDFTDSNGKKVDTDVLLGFSLLGKQGPVNERYVDIPRAKGKSGSKTDKGFLIPENKCLRLSRYKFSVDIFALRKMKKFRFLNIKCPSIEFECGGFKGEVRKQNGSNPDFNKRFDFVLLLPDCTKFLPQMNLKVYDNRLGSKSLVGAAVIRLDSDRFNPDKAGEMKALAIEKLRKTRERHLTLKGALLNKKLSGMGVNVMKASALTSPYEADALNSTVAKIMFASAYYAADTPQPADDDQPIVASQALEQVDAANAEKFQQGDAVEIELEAKERQEEVDALTTEDFSWFDRFEPTEDSDGLSAAMMVSRLHQLVANPIDATCENQFGPFDDNSIAVELNRGWGKRKNKAGVVVMMMSIEKTKLDISRVIPAPSDLVARKGIDFVARIYIISCSHLAAKDNSIFGSASDPYPVLTLSDGSGTTDKNKIVKKACLDDKKFQTLNPEYFIIREVNGTLPQHGNLRIEIFDWNKMLSDELIGFTDVNLEDRWFSTRGYLTSQKDGGTLMPGSYTEKRDLRDEQGQVQGRIELWIDMFSAKSSIPKPIDITPLPPIPLELRVIVWSVRDCVLQDVSIHGEAMTDIYVRCWMNGMRGERQETDVHYRSLDGSGTFNWRMIFPFQFDPRSKKIMPAKDAKTDFSFFRIKKEQKKIEPILKVQIFDSDLFPGTDDFIGETSLNILKMRPAIGRRENDNLNLVRDIVTCCGCFDCCCKPKRREDVSLEEKQRIAVEEFKKDQAAQRAIWEKEAAHRVEQLANQRIARGTQWVPLYSEAEIALFRAQFLKEARRNSLVNALQDFMSTRKTAKEKLKTAKVSGDTNPDAVPGNEPGKIVLPDAYTTPKYWFACRGPKGSCRVGDVQMSFESVRTASIAKNKEKFSAGRGRHEPQALPPPNRPESSFFFLSSPYKAVVHILWKNYKWHILGLLCLIFLLFAIAAFVYYGTASLVKKAFADEPKRPNVVIVR